MPIELLRNWLWAKKNLVQLVIDVIFVIIIKLRVELYNKKYKTEIRGNKMVNITVTCISF